tara:strand:+ start:63 stop:254 length:192 start_codon:yes stop_codon:yes gene_type:complete
MRIYPCQISRGLGIYEDFFYSLPDAKALSSAIDVIGTTIAAIVRARLGSRAIVSSCFNCITDV